MRFEVCVVLILWLCDSESKVEIIRNMGDIVTRYIPVLSNFLHFLDQLICIFNAIAVTGLGGL
jgi:hypothetical protein